MSPNPRRSRRGRSAAGSKAANWLRTGSGVRSGSLTMICECFSLAAVRI